LEEISATGGALTNPRFECELTCSGSGVEIGLAGETTSRAVTGSEIKALLAAAMK
jgi:hypothetical protein